MSKNKTSRGMLARNSRAKRLAQRRKQNLSDLSTNTRKRRALARRLMAEQPLFAFDILSSLIEGYDIYTFLSDSRPTSPSRKKFKSPTARMEMHKLLLDKLAEMKIDSPEYNKTVTKIILNWDNIKKPFKIEFRKLRVTYTFPARWKLQKVQAHAEKMMSLETLEDIDNYWNKITSYGG